MQQSLSRCAKDGGPAVILATFGLIKSTSRASQRAIRKARVSCHKAMSSQTSNSTVTVHSILAWQEVAQPVRLQVQADLREARLNAAQSYDDFMFQVKLCCCPASSKTMTELTRQQEVYAGVCQGCRRQEPVPGGNCTHLCSPAACQVLPAHCH